MALCALLIVAFARFAPGRVAARCAVFRRDRLVFRSCGVMGRTKDTLRPGFEAFARTPHPPESSSFVVTEDRLPIASTQSALVTN